MLFCSFGLNQLTLKEQDPWAYDGTYFYLVSSEHGHSHGLLKVSSGCDGNAPGRVLVNNPEVIYPEVQQERGSMFIHTDKIYLRSKLSKSPFIIYDKNTLAMIDK